MYGMPYITCRMKTISITRARAELFGLVSEVNDAHEPVQITARQGDAVLVSERDWRAIQETLYLLSVPGMRESLREGMETPVADCSSTLDW